MPRSAALVVGRTAAVSCVPCQAVEQLIKEADICPPKQLAGICLYLLSVVVTITASYFKSIQGDKLLECIFLYDRSNSNVAALKGNPEHRSIGKPGVVSHQTLRYQLPISPMAQVPERTRKLLPHKWVS